MNNKTIVNNVITILDKLSADDYLEVSGLLLDKIIEKRKLEIKYCGRCYIAKDVHRYGYCESCWEKARDKK